VAGVGRTLCPDVLPARAFGWYSAVMTLSPALRGTLVPVFILLAVGGAWGAVPALARFAVTGGIAPMGYVFWVAVGAGIFCWILCAVRGVMPQFSGPHIRYYLLSGCSRFVLAGFIMYTVLQNIPAGIVSILLGTAPLMTFVASVTLRHQKFSLRRGIGTVIGLVGILLVFVPATGVSAPLSLGWLALGLVTPLIYAYSNITIDRSRPEGDDSMALTAGIFTLSALIALIMSLATGQFHALWDVEPGLPEMAMFAHAAILSMCFFGLYELIRRTDATFGAQSTYVTTLTGILYGMALLGEQPGLLVWAAAALVLGGVGLVNSGRRAEPGGA
jgi:drug/metabolite transporter (DMT)-like permease